MSTSKPSLRSIFYFTWILLGLIHASSMELMDDEAYYWVYSHYPAWGYFDHPPMIAWLIKAGYTIFHNELGVRLFCFLLHLGTLLLLEALTDKKKPALLFSIIASISFFELAGFAAVPDTPLLFFTALFLYAYRRLLVVPTILSSIAMGITAAALLYSKYHGALVILLVVISNPTLFKKYHLYLAGAIALLLFLPHLYWEYTHNWVSFKYHLFESNVNRYKVEYSLSYIGGQLLLAGPLTGFIILPLALMYKTRTIFERALKFLLAGLFLFFLLSSFRGKVEINWTAPMLIPLVVLSHHALMGNKRLMDWCRKLFPVSILLLLVLRLFMCADFLPVDSFRKKYHGWKHWPIVMRERTKNSFIVFNNSYQRASKYWFYSGQPTYSMNLYKEHRNNYNYWPLEDSMLQKRVYYLDIYDLGRFHDSLLSPLGWIGYREDSFFVSLAKLQLTRLHDHEINHGDLLSMDVVPVMPDSYRGLFSSGKLRGKLWLAIFDKKGWLKDLPVSANLDQLSGNVHLDIPVDLPPGHYQYMFAIETKGYYPTHNSEKFNLRVK